MALTPRLVPGTERVFGTLFAFMGRDGMQHIYDVRTGSERWSWRVELDEGGLPLTTVVDGVAYLADGQGKLVAVRLRRDKK